jgi:hypothetical protein
VYVDAAIYRETGREYRGGADLNRRAREAFRAISQPIEKNNPR